MRWETLECVRRRARACLQEYSYPHSICPRRGKSAQRCRGHRFVHHASQIISEGVNPGLSEGAIHFALGFCGGLPLGFIGGRLFGALVALLGGAKIAQVTLALLCPISCTSRAKRCSKYPALSLNARR